MNTSNLNPKQQAVLDYIKHNTIEQGYPPSVREIGAALGYSSSSTVHGYLRQLEKLGYLHRDPSKPRALVIAQEFNTSNPVQPKADQVNQEILPCRQMLILDADSLSEVEDQLSQYQSTQVVDWPNYDKTNEKLYGYIMNDDSMIQIGIYPGNTLMIKDINPRELNDGDLILFRDQTKGLIVRSYYKGIHYIRLQPEQNSYEPLYIKIADFVCIGKVVANLRFYE